MAERELHNYLCRTILGDDCDRINAFLDAPVRDVGPNHRMVFHDEETIGRMTMFNAEAGMATMLHKILDENKDLANLLRVMVVMDGFNRNEP